MTKYKEFKAEFDEINSSFTDYNLHQKEIYNDLDNARLSSLYNELRDLAIDMLNYIEQDSKEEKSGYKTFEYKNYLIKTREHKGKYTGGIYDIQDTIQHPVDAIYAHHWEDSERVLEAKLLDYVDKEKKKESSILTLTLTYYYFTSKVYWDDNNDWWYICHIFNKADKDILKEDAIIEKDIRELQTKFEDYIDNYLIERNNME